MEPKGQSPQKTVGVFGDRGLDDKEIAGYSGVDRSEIRRPVPVAYDPVEFGIGPRRTVRYSVESNATGRDSLVGQNGAKRARHRL